MTRSARRSRRRRFAAWRRTRPFVGSMFCVASGLLLLLPAYTTIHLGDVMVSISSISGVSTLLLGALMLSCAGCVLVRPGAQVPAGVSAMVIALVALPAANFGGFVLGTVSGVCGAAATLAWTRRTAGAPVPGDPGPASQPALSGPVDGTPLIESTTSRRSAAGRGGLHRYP
ncbi:hypothetical protein LX14_001042 [Williamsia deligens]|nr:hypothetical protein [Williamsia deligens]